MQVTMLAWGLSLIVILYLLWKYAWPVYSKWRLYRRRLNEIEEKYEKARNTREGLLYHFDWKIDSNENTKEVEEAIRNLDIELKQLRQDYKQIQREGMRRFDKTHIY